MIWVTAAGAESVDGIGRQATLGGQRDFEEGKVVSIHRKGGIDRTGMPFRAMEMAGTKC